MGILVRLTSLLFVCSTCSTTTTTSDLPILVRSRYANNVSAFDLNGRMPGHVDIPRLREGKVGGFFWSVYVDCKPEGPYFTKPSYRVR